MNENLESTDSYNSSDQQNVHYQLAETAHKNYKSYCVERKIKVHDGIIKAISDLPKEGGALKLNGNRKDWTNKYSRITIEDIDAIIYSIKSDALFVGIDLSYNNLNSHSTKHIINLLNENPQLHSLNLAYNDLNGRDGIDILDAVRNHPALESLNLNGNPLGPSVGRKLSEEFLLDRMNNLEELDIGNTDQDTESIISLAISLSGNTSLRVLNLDNPRIQSNQEDVLLHIGKMLEQNHTLEKLSLAKFKIYDQSLERFLDFFAKNSKITHLDLRGNQISSDGGVAIGKLLRQFNIPPLVSLNLSGNRIGDRGIVSIVDALLHATANVEILDVSWNGIGEQGLISLVQLAENPNQTAIRTLFLFGNNFTSTASSKWFHVQPSLQEFSFKVDIVAYSAGEDEYKVGSKH